MFDERRCENVEKDGVNRSSRPIPDEITERKNQTYYGLPSITSCHAGHLHRGVHGFPGPLFSPEVHQNPCPSKHVDCDRQAAKIKQEPTHHSADVQRWQVLTPVRIHR